MNIPTKILKNGFEMPVYGLGTWGMGGRFEPDTANDAREIESIRAAIDLGVTHIDTAEVYAAGHSEELVGEAIKDYAREKLFIVSKAHQRNAGWDNLIRATKEILARLQTTYLDLFLLHNPSLEVSIEETMKAMDELVDMGLIKNIGLSNFSAERLEEAKKYTKHGIKANQVHLNLKYRESEVRGVLKYCQENGIMFVAWRPVQKGMLVENPPEILKEMSKKYNKTPSQIAINWLISQDNVVTLSKTSNIEHLKENLGAIGWKLDHEDIERLRKEYPDQQAVSDAVPLI